MKSICINVILFSVLTVYGQEYGLGRVDTDGNIGSLDDEKPDIAFPPLPSSTESGEPDVGDINWNDTVDFLLHVANNKTETKGRSEVTLPDINKPIDKRVGPITLRGEFTARDGRMRSISSLRRTGGVTVVQRGTTYTMTCPIGLGVAHLRYDHYRVKIRRGPSASGSIEGEVGSNSFSVNATISLTETGCMTTLNNVHVEELSGLKVRVHGLGSALDSLLSRITTMLTDVFRNDVVRNLEKVLTRELTKVLDNSKCERYASYFIFVDPK